MHRGTRRRFGPWVVGGAAAALHAGFCYSISQTPSEGSWQWFPVFLVDFPFSIVITVLSPKGTDPLFAFGVFGSLWWFLLGSGSFSLFAKGLRAVATWRPGK